MQQVQLSDHLYFEAEKRANAFGFKSVDDYIAEVLSSDLEPGKQDLDHLFTQERIALIDESIERMNAGQGSTPAEIDVRLAEKRAAWLRDNIS